MRAFDLNSHLFHPRSIQNWLSRPGRRTVGDHRPFNGIYR